MNKLIVFDFDSTLCDVETIDEIAKEINIEEQIASITTEAMNGRLSFFESLINRVSLLKGIPFN
jgi:phosphoserine phosphatase